MAIEIERKFLVRHTRMLDHSAGTAMRQGYLARGEITVRVRVAGEHAWLTLKSATRGISRQEFEYPIPVTDAESLLALCDGPALEKTRHRIPVGEHVFEVDVFAGALAPLVLAEVELRHEQEQFTRPDWLGDEVTDDPRYRNSELVVQLRGPR